MRAITAWALGLGLILSAQSAVVARDEPLALIDKAIKAHGGADKLFKYKASRAKSKGTLEIGGMSLSYTQEIQSQQPNQFREDMELEVGGQQIKVVTAFDGEKGWIEANGQLIDATDKMLEELREAGNMVRLGRLSNLKDKSVQLSPLGESAVDGKKVVGIKVSSAGFRDMNLFFDKETGLHVKTERRVTDLMTMQEVTEERIIVEYQDLDGTKAAKRMLVKRNGEKFVEAEVLEVKGLDKLDPSLFKRP